MTMDNNNDSSSSPASPTEPGELDISGDGGGRESPDLPLTMTASTVLMHLPRDATAALASIGTAMFAPEKVVLRFKPVGGSAPALKRGDRIKVASTHKFESVVSYVRKALKVQDTDSVFLYVNSTFAPALDEVVGNLWTCFKDASNQLNVSYSMTPSFG
ncbi:Ubiquitin-like protein atg12 [Diplogelasinospora grovesii]|uniref:Ubiquitin-like protein ATG12 n=1 Tax=Diplogelasinospora grovesii TaxID=303347 RepID=A0AAN6S2S9_9PEZI|nr:Ubiquitin-like protein atg12 [Diplogelasinospora grovesii]